MALLAALDAAGYTAAVMLETMRRNSNSVLMYILFAGLAAVFALSFGPSSSGLGFAGGGEYAAVVDGEVIPADRYRVTLSRERAAIQQRFAGAAAGMNTDFLTEGLAERVIDRLIATLLLKHEAERLGLAVSDDELAKVMRETVFANDDDDAEQVTPQIYRDWVRRTWNVTPERYEDNLRGDLMAQKVQDMTQGLLAVSDNELETAYRVQNNRAQVHFVRYDPNRLGEIPAASGAEVDLALENDTAELEEHYNATSFRYRVPEERKLRQIIKVIPEGATEGDEAQLRAELVELKEQIDGGADFETLVRDESDPNPDQPAEPEGFVTRDDLEAELARAVFALAADAISQPIKSGQTLRLVQVVEIKESATQPFSEVQRDVALSYLAQKTKMRLAREAAEELLAKLKNTKTKLEDVTVAEEDQEAAEGALVRVTSPWILKTQDSVPRIGPVEGLVETIFALSDDAPLVPDVIESNGAFFVVALDKRERPDMDDFEENKESLRDIELSKKRNRAINDWVEYLRDQAEVRLNPELFSEGDAA